MTGWKLNHTFFSHLPASNSASSTPCDDSWVDHGVACAAALIQTRTCQRDAPCAALCFAVATNCCFGDMWIIQVINGERKLLLNGAATKRAIKGERGVIKPPHVCTTCWRLTLSRPEKRPCRANRMRAAGNKCLAGTDPTAFRRHGDVQISFPPLRQHKKGSRTRKNAAQGAIVT